MILDIIRYVHNRHTKFLCVLIAFIRTAIITLDIDDHHIAVLGKPFVAFSYRRFEMTLPRDILKKEIIKYAKERYELKYRSQVKDRVRKMTAEEAQKFLDELVENDPLLGINILKS